jgi:periplasmic protein TonB
MEEKKSPKAGLEGKRTIFLQIGFIVALTAVLFAFNIKSYERGNKLDIRGHMDDIPEVIVPITRQELKPPPPPPQQQITLINIVDNTMEIEEDLMLDVGADQFTEIPEYIPVIALEDVPDEDEIFEVVELMPAFPGGDAAMMRFLKENIKYPQIARETGIRGTVIVTFVVERDGSVTDVRVLRGIGGGCDEEAVRVIRQMPKWVPGHQLGKPVRVQFNMPIRFILQG